MVYAQGLRFTMEVLETIKKQIGARFRLLRLKAGYKSADAFAQRMEVSANTVYELERGENWISPDILERAAKVTGFPLSLFFGEPAVMEPTPQEALAVLARLVDAPARPPAKAALVDLIDGMDEAQLRAAKLLMDGIVGGPRVGQIDRQKKKASE